MSGPLTKGDSQAIGCDLLSASWRCAAGSPEVEPTVQRLIAAFMRLHKVEWHAPVISGCTPGEIRVLFHLRRASRDGVANVRVSDISRMLDVSPPMATQILKTMDARHLIERTNDPDDRRVVYVRLTVHGEQVGATVAHTFITTMRGLIDFLGEDQSNQLADLLMKTFSYFHQRAQDMHGVDANGEPQA